MGHVMLPRAEGDSFEGHCPFHTSCLEGMATGPALQARWGIPAERLPINHPAWDVEGLLITPHIAGLSRDYMGRLCRSFVENLQAFETGMTPPNTVNRNRGY